jgi:glyoxylase-like metal-dependent hydrolase (beta-lactamase superfamily II)
MPSSDLWLSQSPIWQTNSALLEAGGEVLLCDPAYTAGEIDAIRREVDRRSPAAVRLLLTHADFDHTCGIAAFPEAEVIAGAATAERIASGEAARALAEQGPEWGTRWGTELRVDRVVEPGAFTAGGFAVEAMDAPGHQVDGLAFALPGEGLLLPGDYLSAITFPFVVGSLDAAIATLRGLHALLAGEGIERVVPGHGPPLTQEEARAIGADDLGYLEALREAAGEARSRGLAPGPALLHVYAVQPPRPNTDDFEVYGIRAFNARQALAQAG